MSEVANLIGLKFDKLTVIERGNNLSNGKATWICVCDCGKRKEKSVTTSDLRSGKVKSCGCLYKESNKNRNKKHGDSNTRLYHIWAGMKARCDNMHNIVYYCYGGRGITYCNEWRDYVNFKNWALNNGYNDRLTLERKDVNDNYYPENCCWATMKEQQNNRRNTVYININGEENSASQWSEITGISSETLRWRLKNNWKESDMLIPVSYNNKNLKKQKENKNE